MKLTKQLLNTVIFFAVGILMIGFTYFSMIFAASDIYGDQEGSESNIFMHFIRISLLGLTFLAFFINGFKIHLTRLSTLVLIWFGWMFVSNLASLDRYIINLTVVLFWPSIFFLFSFFRVNLKSDTYVTTLFLIIFILASIFYLFIVQARNVDLEGRLASVNHIYYILLLLPWVFVMKKKFISNIFLIIIILLTVYSAKRGAMLAVFFTSAVYIYLSYFKSGNKGFNPFGIIVGVILVFVSVYVFNLMNESSGGYLVQRFENIESDKGSGRLDIYSEVLNKFDRSTWELKLIGHGHNKVKESNSFFLSAHNDFIEVLYDYGVVGLILLILITKELAFRVLKLYRMKSPIFVHYMAAFIVFLFMTMISHIILYPTYIIFLMSYLGFMDPVVSKELKLA